MTGTMMSEVSLLGTSLRLEEGQQVRMDMPTNIPGAVASGKWFVSPIDGRWGDSSILVDKHEVKANEN